MTERGPFALASRFVHLDDAGGAQAQPPFDGWAWYADYEARSGGSGRLVALHSFDTSWDSWEMHPAGDEMVVCTCGALTLVQQGAEGDQRIELVAGQYAINPAGVWHTADADAACEALFITAGAGTVHKPR